jgi:hypothetical protein
MKNDCNGTTTYLLNLWNSPHLVGDEATMDIELDMGLP